MLKRKTPNLDPKGGMGERNICGKLGHDNKYYPMSKDWRSVCPQYGDWLRAGWTAKETGKEKYSSKEKNRGISAE